MYIYLSSFKQFHYFQHDMTTAVYIYIYRERERERERIVPPDVQHSGNTWISVYCFYSLATREGLYFVCAVWRHVQICVLCLHLIYTCCSVHCVYILSTRAGLCVVSTLWWHVKICALFLHWRHVQVCLLCLHSVDTCSLCIVSTLWLHVQICVIRLHWEQRKKCVSWWNIPSDTYLYRVIQCLEERHLLFGVSRCDDSLKRIFNFTFKTPVRWSVCCIGILPYRGWHSLRLKCSELTGLGLDSREIYVVKKRKTIYPRNHGGLEWSLLSSNTSEASHYFLYLQIIRLTQLQWRRQDFSNFRIKCVW